MLEGINSKTDDTVMDQLTGRQSRGNHSAWTEKKKKNLNENSLKELWDKIKHANICIIGVPEREERERDSKLFE